MIGITFRNGIIDFGIEVFKTFKRGSRFNIGLCSDGNACYTIAIKIRTRQSLCNLRINANSVHNLTQIINARLILIVDCYNRNLECARMRISYQSKLSAVLVRRSIAFIFLNISQGKQNFASLTGERNRLQSRGITICTLSKIRKQFTLNCRVLILHNLIIFILILLNRSVKLLFDEFRRLFRQELRGKRSRHVVPFAFLFQFVNRAQMLFAIFANILALTIGCNSCTERVIRIFLSFLKNGLVRTHHRRAFELVGVKHNIFTRRELIVISINGHTLEIMSIIDKNTNLCIMTIPQRQILNTTANLDNTIHVFATFIAIPDSYATRIKTRRTLKLPEGLATIFRIVISNGFNLITMLIRITLVFIRCSKNSDISLLAFICGIRNANAISQISMLGFENIGSFIQLTFGNAKGVGNAFRNINHAFLVDFLFQNIGNLFGTITLRNILVGKHTANSRFRKVHISGNGSIAKTIFTKASRTIIKQLLPIVFCLLLSNTEFRSTQLVLFRKLRIDNIKDFAFLLAGLLQLVNSRKEITGSLIGRITRAPRISSGVTLCAVMNQRIIIFIRFPVNPIIGFDVVQYRIQVELTSVLIRLMTLSNSMILLMMIEISFGSGVATITSSH